MAKKKLSAKALKAKRSRAAKLAAVQRDRAKRARERSKRSRAAKLGHARRKARLAAPAADIDDLEDLDLDDLLEDLSAAWGVQPYEAADLLEASGVSPGQYLSAQQFFEAIETDERGRPDGDQMVDLAQDLDIDVHSLFNLYYGYPP